MSGQRLWKYCFTLVSEHFKSGSKQLKEEPKQQHQQKWLRVTEVKLEEYFYVKQAQIMHYA